MNTNIKKITNILSIVLILILCIIMTFGIELSSYDELWNFQNIFKMYNGFTIYKDSNVIVTPLFFYIENIFFHILEANFLTYRLTNILLCSLFFFIIYIVQKNLKLIKYINIFFIVPILLDTIYLYAYNGPNYNLLALIFFMIGMNLYISKKNSNIAQGIIIFLIFFTKQTIAFFYVLAIVIYELYKYGFSKKFFENQLKKVFIFIIPSILALFIFYLNNNLENFINYTLGGLFDFSERNFYFGPKIYDVFIIVIAYLLSISILISKKFLLKHDFSNDFFENIIILLIFSSCAALIVYPIINIAHTKMALPFYFIILSYIFNTIFKDFFDDAKLENIFNIIIVVLLAVFTIKYAIECIGTKDFKNSQFVLDKSSPYFSIPVPKDSLDKIEILTNYIEYQNSKGIDVIICSYDSALAMIQLKQSHGAYDLIFYGNLGYNGIEKMKADLLSKNQTEFIILKNEDDMFGQEVREIRECIINNLTKRGEILNYDIYSK